MPVTENIEIKRSPKILLVPCGGSAPSGQPENHAFRIKVEGHNIGWLSKTEVSKYYPTGKISTTHDLCPPCHGAVVNKFKQLGK
jgi:hypothetical protein